MRRWQALYHIAEGVVNRPGRRNLHDHGPILLKDNYDIAALEYLL